MLQPSEPSAIRLSAIRFLTNVDCPWDLAEFGGRFPFVALFADRPDALRHGHCFPAAHAGSGYALIALYFTFRERRGLLARLGMGVITGRVSGIAQQSRGAHFISHDAWSAFLVWAISLSIYTFMFRARRWDSVQQEQSGYAEHDAPVAAGRLVVDGAVDMRDRAC